VARQLLRMRASLLLDIDGTLVDSTEVVEGAWAQVASEFRADASEVVRACHGRRATDLARQFFGECDPTRIVARVAQLERERAYGVRPLPGAVALMSRVRAGQWAAITSGPRQTMEERLVLAGLPVPDVFVAAEDVVRGKPDPEGFAVAASALGVQPGTCVVIEDSPAGVAAGRTFGATVIAVLGTHTARDLRGAHRIIYSLHDLAAVLEDFSYDALTA
jgi:mannitol-1-/sugar-/sorbitol-6-phosphatase